MKNLSKLLIASSVVSSLVLISGGAVYFKPQLYALANIGEVTVKPSQLNEVVLATVNGKPVFESDLTPLLQKGIDRPTALDRRISQIVLAQSGESKYPKETQAAINAAKEDVFAQIFVNKRSAELMSEISDKEIEAFYEKNVTSEQFRSLKIKAFLTADAKEGQTFYEKISGPKSDKSAADALTKLQYLNKQGDHFTAIQDVPYNLGQVMKNMKAGEILQPIVIREGVLVAMIEEIKDLPKPSVEKLKEEIRSYLLNARIEKEVISLRKLAKIELKT